MSSTLAQIDTPNRLGNPSSTNLKAEMIGHYVTSPHHTVYLGLSGKSPLDNDNELMAGDGAFTLVGGISRLLGRLPFLHFPRFDLLDVFL